MQASAAGEIAAADAAYELQALRLQGFENPSASEIIGWKCMALCLAPAIGRAENGLNPLNWGPPMSFDKIVPIQLTALPTYECGAVVLAFLVHPETDAAAQRAEVQHALCQNTLVSWATEDPAWAATPQLVKPIYLTQDQKAVEAALNTFDRRLRDRLVAARMAIAFLKHAEVNGPIALPKGVKQLSIKEMAQHVMGDAGASDTGNVETRIWKPSLPVIHLAAALAVVMDTAEKGGVPKLRVDQILRSREFIESVIQTAQRYETLIEQSDKLARHAAPLWRFRVT